MRHAARILTLSSSAAMALGKALLVVFALLSAGARMQTPAEAKSGSYRLTRPANEFDGQFAFTSQRVSAANFDVWRRQYANPSVCNVVLCRATCKQYIDACPSFSGLTVLDLEHPGSLCLLNGCFTGSCTAGNRADSMPLQPGCCTEQSHNKSCHD